MNNKLKWRIINYTEGDEKEIIKLMQGDIKLRGSQAIFNEAYWNWKFRNNVNGFSENEIFIVKNIKNKIIGHCAFIPFFLSFKGKKLKSAQLVDILVQADYRNNGIFSSMVKNFDSFQKKFNFDILTCFPNERSYPFLNKSGWLNILTVEELIYVLNPSKVAKTKMSNPILASLANLYLSVKFKKTKIKNIIKNSKYKVDNIKKFTEKEFTITKNNNKKNLYLVNRDPNYLNWRYLENPTYDKIIKKILIENKDPKGFYILVIKKYPHRGDLIIAHIMELISNLNDETYFQAMLTDILNIGKIYDVDILHIYTHKNQHGYNILKKFGFMRFDKKQLMIRLNESEERFRGIKNPQNWFIALGDSDRA